MKNKGEQLIDTNLLEMFPASKNFPVEELPHEDPLEELLLEFSHIQDDEVDLEENVLEVEALMVEDILKKNRDKNELVQDQIMLLEETSQRMKFLLDEIELYLPKK
ncbi:MAG: hypothetical protein KC493_18280, partial [Bacteriovoracaceae bacterium]|nr:hypothetical protein [Bacteriovoracaceae bacterium]